MNDAAPTAATSDESVWSGSPSQIVNLPAFVICTLLCWLVVPIFVALWKWLVVRNIRYELTTERLKLREGVLNKVFNEVELYRVRDYRAEQPWYLRPFSLGHVIMGTTDASHPTVTIRAVRDVERVLDLVRRNVEDCRARKNVRAIDLE
ncbi:MAG TPA: PH domain-containing protein [Burkholderiales bacterium]|jgi:membrane protein YdbS with pleckstrin-like domain|nr:PH domain-containing protein [Burkholderiales bacterium]